MISRDLQPGDHQGLPFHPGWWCREGGGIADFVLDDPNSGWYIDGPPR